MPGQRYISDGQKAKRYLPNEKSSACGAWQRRLTVLFAAAVLSALPAAALGVGAATTATTTSALNVRSGTGTSYSVLKVLSKSSEVTVLDTTSNTSWYKVLLSDGTTGYCSSKYLNLTGTMTTTTALNLRKGASTSYSIITTMSKGTSVTVLSSSNGWARVKTSSGTIGYCSLQYLAADTSVTLSSSSVSLTVGGTKTLTADTTVTWSSSDTSVVTVSSSGKLTAIKADTGSIKASKAYNRGFFHIQDISSQLCCEALNVQEGQTVIDACSAPGGKSFTLAQLMKNQGRLIAGDMYRPRLNLVEEGAKRLGISIISTVLADASQAEYPMADRILCDVPCSGLGVIRRKPELRYKKDLGLKALPELQYKILCSCSKYLKPGGLIVYSTCTLNPTENQLNARRFLSEHPDFEPQPLALRQKKTAYLEERENELTLFPQDGTDGFFISTFRKRGITL